MFSIFSRQEKYSIFKSVHILPKFQKTCLILSECKDIFLDIDDTLHESPIVLQSPLKECHEKKPINYNWI